MLLNKHPEKTIGRLPSLVTRAFTDIKERRAGSRLDDRACLEGCQRH